MKDKTYKQDKEECIRLLNLFDTQIEDAEIILDRNTAALDTSLKNDEALKRLQMKLVDLNHLVRVSVFFATRFKKQKIL